MNTRRIGLTIGSAIAAWGLAASVALATEISFWTWRQEDKAAYTEIFSDFTKLNPDITVKFESFPDENYPTIVSTALAAGRGGDVIHTHAYGWLEQFAKAGYFVPLDRASVPSIDNMPADALVAGTYRADGRLYSLPFASQTLGLFINKDVFAKAGLTPPKTWDEFLAVGKALKDKGIIPLANGLGTSWFNEMFVAIFTNPFLGPDFVGDLTSGKTTFKDPRYVAALGKLLELRDDMPTGYEGVDYDTAGQLFLTGRAAMLAGGSFDISTYRSEDPGIDMAFVAPPAPKAGAPAYVTKFYDGGYAVNAASPNREAALKLVNYMGTKAFGDKLSALLGDISPIKGVEIKDPMLAEVAALNRTAMPHINVVYFRFQKPTGSELLQGDITRMMAGAITPDQLAADLTAGIAKWYAPFQGK
ncbi:extracellular solute-binding protein [Labrys monachus]|uniref:Raffinose/stachyose/melibiose transport system substrate-binding protein n=1 Tax=Labrys monachus TaxID=217067 RepID=A0ABU0FEH8_9HYPH|nr:extracellular solute-binding protein [Labrys monachus]MDQ0392931.1 raffinose/stachyose/melibiose transport system substrate-binding protein [Labrys monachus]